MNKHSHFCPRCGELMSCPYEVCPDLYWGLDNDMFQNTLDTECDMCYIYTTGLMKGDDRE